MRVRKNALGSAEVRRLGIALVLAFYGVLGCAHASPPSPKSEGEKVSAPAQNPSTNTTLSVTYRFIEELRSPFFWAMEVTFENSSNKWHTIERIEFGPERQMSGPRFEVLGGERLRIWQLASREVQLARKQEQHLFLDELAPNAVVPGTEGAPLSTVPAAHLQSLPITIVPGLFTRRWVVFHSTEQDALVGKELVLEYTLANGTVERILVKVPTPKGPAKKD